MKFYLIFAICIAVVSADITCRFHENVCDTWCTLVGHSDGKCNEKLDCICSGQEANYDSFVCGKSAQVKEDTSDDICAGYCQLVRQRQTGECNAVTEECECSSEYLRERHIQCVHDNVCALYCQGVREMSTGHCGGTNGWDCICDDASSFNSTDTSE